MAVTEPAAPVAADAPRPGLVFDDDFLRKLERLDLTARKIFRGLLRGEHATPRRGRGLEFSDFRRYRPGDDIRHIDWNIFSRLDRLFLKLFSAEEDVTLHLLLDASASMGFGEPTKFDQARRIVAALAFVGLNNLDRVRLSAFADGLDRGLAPLKARHHMAAVLAFLNALDAGGHTDYARACRDFRSRNRQPGLVVFVSDLLGGDARDGLDVLRAGGHEVVVVQLLDESEIDPPLAGALRLTDSEGGPDVLVTVDEGLRELYRERMARHLEALETYCRSQSLEYLRASTAIDFEDVVLRYLRQGSLLR